MRSIATYSLMSAVCQYMLHPPQAQAQAPTLRKRVFQTLPVLAGRVQSFAKLLVLALR
jgi:hypothetical protein